MAKSKLIKKLVSNEISIIEALDRLLLIAIELNDVDTVEWIKNEKNGYYGNEIPDYRYTVATPIGNYQIITMGNLVQYNQRVLPTIGIPQNIKDEWSNYPVRESITILLEQKKSYEKGKISGIPIPMELYSMFEKGTNVEVTSAFLTISEFSIAKIIDNLKTKMLELLMLYEKNFGELDQFDVDVDEYNIEEMKKIFEIAHKIINENYKGDIYIINSKVKKSNIGDNNQINKSSEVSLDLNINKEEKKGLLSKIKRLFNKKKS